MRDISFDADDVRVIAHLVGVSVWLGGQIVMLGLVPALRRVGGDATRVAAGAYSLVAWPAFGLTVVTGIWSLLAIDVGDASSGYNAAFGVKMLLVLVTGGAAAVHQNTPKPVVRGATGGIGLLASLGALVLGALMAH